jgi:acetyltransferase-like isoleucine patch superfamily enzyme
MNFKKWLKNIAQRFQLIGILMIRVYQLKFRNTVKKIIKGENNQINYANARLTSVIFDIQGNGNNVEIKEGSIFNNVTIFIRGNKHKILIGKNCSFNRGGNIWLEDNNCILTIGEKTTFEDVHLALTEPGSKISIGSDCMFAYDIDVRTGDSHSIISQESNDRINFAKDVYIGNHVWIAAHSIILKGTFISEDSVVATGSVVTGKHKFKKGTIIGGNPARQLTQGITWSRERIYKTN